MPDQQDGGHLLRDDAYALEQFVRGRGVQLRVEPYRGGGAERGPHPLERLACALGRGAEDELGLDSERD